MVMWGANVVAGRLAVGEVSPMMLVTLRWVISCVLIGAIAQRQIRADWPVLRTHWLYAMAMGTLGYTGFNALFYVAAYHTQGINMAILQGSMPILIFVGAYCLFHTPVRPLQLVGVILTMAGIATVASHGSLATLAAFRFNAGDILLLLACLLYSGYTLGLRYKPRVSGIGFFAAMAFAALVSTLPLLAFEIAQGDFHWPTLKGWGIILFIGIGPSLLSQLSYIRSVELIGAARAGVFTNLVPIFGALLSVIVLREEMALYHGLALLLVMLGIFLAERTSQRMNPA